MNIIEAIKSGKEFRRKGWNVEYFYLPSKNNNSMLQNTYTNNTRSYDTNDIISYDWEVKEQEEVKKEVTFDPTKPVQVRYGDKARILCDNLKGDKPICAAIDMESQENIGFYNTDGKFTYKDGTKNPILDLINIPEPKTIDIHFGGVYKERSGDIHICVENRIKKGAFNEYSTFCSLNIGCSGSYLFDLHKDRIIEHLGDIQDLNQYIKDKLK